MGRSESGRVREFMETEGVRQIDGAAETALAAVSSATGQGRTREAFLFANDVSAGNPACVVVDRANATAFVSRMASKGAPDAFDLRSRHGFEAMAEALEAEAPGGVGVAFRELDRVARSKRSTEEALAAWTLHAATEGTDATRRTTGVLGTSPKADREAIASMATGTDLAEKWRADPEFRGKLGEIAPVFASMATRWQDSQHHSFGLMEHVLHAVDAVDVTGLSERESRTLKAAALFHDCGKAEAAFYRVAKTYGRIVESFAGHAKISAAVAETVLRSAGFPEAETRDVAFLVRRHDSFMAFDGGPSGMESLEAAIRALADESGPERVALLARLMAADAAAQAETVHGRFGEIVATRGDKIAKAKAVERIALGF